MKNAPNNWRYCFSFYVSSVKYQSWRDFRTDEELMGFVKHHGWFVNDHSLLESQVVNVGYVIGKHPDWTYRHGLEEQIQDHF